MGDKGSSGVEGAIERRCKSEQCSTPRLSTVWWSHHGGRQRPRASDLFAPRAWLSHCTRAGHHQGVLIDDTISTAKCNAVTPHSKQQ